AAHGDRGDRDEPHVHARPERGDRGRAHDGRAVLRAVKEGPMAERTFTILDDGRATAVAAQAGGGRVLLSPGALAASLGWERKPQGLCRGDVCIPQRAVAPALANGDVDLAALAGVLDRPVAIDAAEGAAYVGASAGDRQSQLASLRAPDFTL